MKRAAKLVLAALVTAVLFFSPVGACAETKTVTTKPCHPSSPGKRAPIPSDCARPGCIYLDTRVIPVAPAPDSQLLLGSAISVVESRDPAPASKQIPLVVLNSPKPLIDLFLTCGQFLV